MRIGIVSIINEPWGGSEELWASLADIALNNGHQIFHSSVNCGQVANAEKKLQLKGLITKHRSGFFKHGLPVWRRILWKFYYQIKERVFPSLDFFVDNQCDIVLYVGTGLSLHEHKHLLSPIFRAVIPVVVNVQLNQEGARFLSHIDYTFLRSFYNSVKAVYFVSKQNWKSLEKMLAIEISNGVLVRNPVNMPDTSIVTFPAKNQDIQLAMVGNLLCMHKGQDTMLQVLAQAHCKNEPWHLNIYGQGMDRQYLEDLAQLYGIAHKITFHGRVQDIRQLWAQNHLLLMPSVMEGMPLAVVEAMLCGRPVLATDVGGHTEWIEDNVQGFIAAAPSLHALNEAWQRAWQSRNTWKQMGENAHEKASKLYDPAPGKTLLNLMEQMVAKH